MSSPPPPPRPVRTAVRITLLVLLGGLVGSVGSAALEDFSGLFSYLVQGLIFGALVIGGLTWLIAWQIVSDRKKYRAAVEEAERSPAERLRKLNAEVASSMQNTTSLLDDLTRELEAQRVASESIMAKAEEQQRFLEINQEQAEKIRQILVGETKETIRAERRTQWMFFALGAAVSIPIGVLINVFVP